MSQFLCLLCCVWTVLVNFHSGAPLGKGSAWPLGGPALIPSCDPHIFPFILPSPELLCMLLCHSGWVLNTIHIDFQERMSGMVRMSLWSSTGQLRWAAEVRSSVKTPHHFWDLLLAWDRQQLSNPNEQLKETLNRCWLMESCWGVVARWYCTLLCSVGTGPADTRWFIPCKSAQNVADASVFLYAAHSSRMLPIQKCWDFLSPLVQIGCFGGADLLQSLREEQQLVKAKHKLHWNSCSVLQKLHAGS